MGMNYKPGQSSSEDEWVAVLAGDHFGRRRRKLSILGIVSPSPGSYTGAQFFDADESECGIWTADIKYCWYKIPPETPKDSELKKAHSLGDKWIEKHRPWLAHGNYSRTFKRASRVTECKNTLEVATSPH